MTERKAFMSVVADIDDAKLEGLAERKGVATLVKPGDEAGEGTRDDTRVSRTRQAAVNPDSIPTPRSKMKSVKIEIPDYVYTELRVRAAHRSTTVKHVIMTSLRLEGFDIRDVDMIEDGRRDRGGDDR